MIIESNTENNKNFEVLKEYMLKIKEQINKNAPISNWVSFGFGICIGFLLKK